MIGGHIVGALDDEVPDGAWKVDGVVPLKSIREFDRGITLDPRPYRAGESAGGDASPAGPGVTSSSDLPARAPAMESTAFLQQFLHRGFIAFRAVALVDHRAVPFQPQPFQFVEDEAVGTFDRPRPIEIIDPHEPSPEVAAGIEVAGERRDDGAEVKGSCRGGGEPAAVRRRHERRLARLALAALLNRLAINAQGGGRSGFQAP